MGLVDRLAARVMATGLRRGVLEGSREWFVVGVSVAVVRMLRRVLAEPEVRASVELHPGDALEIRVVEPPAR